MRVLVSGSRHWKDRELLFTVLDDVHDLLGVDVIIEGCARGADSLAEEWAGTRQIPLEHYPADWTRHGKSAGPIRNNQMLVEGKPDVVVAFHDELHNSAGTGDMVHKAEKAGVTVMKVAH